METHESSRAPPGGLAPGSAAARAPSPVLRARQLLVSRTDAGAEARWAFGLAWLSAPVVEVALRVWGLAPTLDRVERVAGVVARARAVWRGVGGASLDRGGASSQLDAVAWTRRLVAVAYRAHVVSGRCLPRSVVQYGLLLARGERDARLVVGVRRGHHVEKLRSPSAPLEAHAWVERVGPPEAQREPRSADESGADGFEALYVREPRGAP